MAEDDLPAAVQAALPEGWRLAMGLEQRRYGQVWAYTLTAPSGNEQRWEEPAIQRERFREGTAAFDAACIRAAVALALGEIAREGQDGQGDG